MKMHLFGVALICIAPPYLGQSAQSIETPPPQGKTMTWVPQERTTTWEAEQRDGYLLEESMRVDPRFIVPETGLFTRGQAQENVHGQQRNAPPVLLPGLDPVYGPGIPRRAVLSDDLAADTEARPLMFGWEGVGPNGLTPPDPNAACGYDHVVVVTNDDFAVYDKCGKELYSSDIHSYLGIDSSYLLYDPKVVFDPWGARWVMLWHKRQTATEESSLLLVITAVSTPFGLVGSGTYYYDFDALQLGGTPDASFADYFDLGYSNNFLTAGGNMFRFAGGFLWGRVWTWDKAEVYSAASAGVVRMSGLTNPDGTQVDSPRTPQMQASWGEGGFNIDGTYINSRGGGGDKLTLWKMTDAFGTNTMVATEMSVSAYALPPYAVQPSGDLLDTIDCRLMPAVIALDTLGSNGIELFTSLTTSFGSDARVHLFKIDPVSFAVEFESSFGATNLDYWFACPAADYSGSNFWVFSRTGTSVGNEPELRFVDYNQGAFSSASSSIRDGDGSYNGFRWGDYFGGQMDWADYSANFGLPGRPAKVWLYGEYGKANDWGTYVGTTSVWTQGQLSAVSPSTRFISSGPLGGPFVPASQVYTLTNSGEVGAAFEVTGLPSWLDVSQAQGNLNPGSTLLTFSVNAAANSLPQGIYESTVTIRDCFFGGLSYTRDFELRVDVDAFAVFRNAGANPASYSTTLPILGTTVIGQVDLGGTTGHLFAGLVGYLTPLSFTLPGGQVLLVNIADPGGELLSQPLVSGPLAVFPLVVPMDLSMAGTNLSVQAFHFLGVTPYALANAYDMRLGF